MSGMYTVIVRALNLRNYPVGCVQKQGESIHFVDKIWVKVGRELQGNCGRGAGVGSLCKHM